MASWRRTTVVCLVVILVCSILIKVTDAQTPSAAPGPDKACDKNDPNSLCNDNPPITVDKINNPDDAIAGDDDDDDDDNDDDDENGPTKKTKLIVLGH
ncbi:hypothetical protein Dimus_019680 [Dionaea muscipula]